MSLIGVVVALTLSMLLSYNSCDHVTVGDTSEPPKSGPPFHVYDKETVNFRTASFPSVQVKEFDFCLDKIRLREKSDEFHKTWQEIDMGGKSLVISPVGGNFVEAHVPVGIYDVIIFEANRSCQSPSAFSMVQMTQVHQFDGPFELRFLGDLKVEKATPPIVTMSLQKFYDGVSLPENQKDYRFFFESTVGRYKIVENFKFSND